jgi:hypothetical protein
MCSIQNYRRLAVRAGATAAAVIGLVGITYPGGWGQLTADVRSHETARRTLVESESKKRELEAEIEAGRVRYELQTAHIDLLASGRSSYVEAVSDFSRLYESDSPVLIGVREQYPGLSDAEISAARVYWLASKRSGVSERRIEEWASDYAKMFGKPVPKPVVTAYSRDWPSPPTSLRSSSAGRQATAVN